MGRRILKESETILAMTSLILRDKGIRGTKITEQVQNYNESGTNFVTSQNFIYNPISEYDDILLTYGKNMHSQRFVYGAKDKDKGLIKIDSYQKYGNKWNDNMSATYVAPADYIKVHYAEETFTKGKAPITQYVIKDIRGSIEQLTSKQGYKAITYTYTAFGEEKFPMNLNDIHGFAGYVRDRETDSYYANARQYLPQIHRFMSKDKLRVDSLNRYLYVMNNPVNLVDPSGLFVMNPRDIPANNSTLCAGTLDNALDCLQGALDVVGFAFDTADGINAIISFMRGNVLDGILNLIAVVPAVGSAIAVPMKSIFKVLNAGGDITKYVGKIVDILGGADKAISHLDSIMAGIKTVTNAIPNGIRSLTNYVKDSWFIKHFIGSSNVKALDELVGSISSSISSLNRTIKSKLGKVTDTIKNFGKISFKTGKEGEQYLAKKLGGETQKYINTPIGKRFIDVYSKGIAHESKVGYASLTDFVKKQIQKDVYARDILGEVDEVVWYFFESGVTGKKGPSKPLEKFLIANGIKIIRH